MPDSAEIELLKRQQAAFKGQLKGFKTKITSTDSIGGFESLLRRIQLVYDKYDLVQNKLELFDDSNSIDRSVFEDDYDMLEATLRNKVHELKKSEDAATSFLNASTHEVNPAAVPSVGIRLPEITLPSFNGLDSEWLAFRDIFIDLIHSKTLEPTVKFLYLISSVRSGSAYHIIESLPVTAANCEIAWAALCDRFNNEINIQRHHTRELYNIRSLSDQSSKSLQMFVDRANKHYGALKSLNVNVASWDLILVHHLTQKLDDASRVYIVKNSKLNSILSFLEFIQLLRTRIRVLDVLSPLSSQSSARVQRDQRRIVLNTSNVYSTPLQGSKCAYCSSGSHMLPDCPAFSSDKMSPRMRFHFIKDRRLCGNCLVERHLLSECMQGSCTKCLLKHHELLHFPPKNAPTFPESSTLTAHPSSTQLSYELEASNPESNKGTSCSATYSNPNPSVSSISTSKDTVLLGTALVLVSSENELHRPCRALLDSGSTINFITSKTCALLRARELATNKIISGIGASETQITSKTYLTITSRVSDFHAQLKFYVIPKITSTVPSVHLSTTELSLPCTVELADPQFNVPSCIDILLGVELYQQLFKGPSIRCHPQLPPFYETEFGYVVCGRTTSKGHGQSCHQTNIAMIEAHPLEDQIKQFWELEECPSKPVWSKEEVECEEHYGSNVSRLQNGRYVVALPTKPNITHLGNSKYSAQNQFFALERRLSKTEDTYVQYRTFMNEYLALGHMTPTIPTSINPVFYLPHHCVVKDHSSTTKLRVVFNASSRTSSRLSLNDCLMVGPTVQQDLFSILLRFRKHEVALCGDIAKMYRQILVRDDQTDLQRVLWRSQSSEKLTSFSLRTVTYGTACAPFLATRTLNQLANDERSNCPIASSILERDFYVDDVLTGASSLDAAIQLKTDLTNLLQSGGFELRKFFSNVSQLASDDQSNSSTTLLLGLLWDTNADHLETQLDKLPTSSTCTKREMLSEICRLFDPLGMCSPIIVTAKLFMQEIWMQKNIGWDDLLSADIAHKWTTFKSELSTLNHVSIPRLVVAPNAKEIELHGFCDASEKAYGCVLYTRTLNSSNEYTISLLCAKSKVAPLKRETIPRLELCAAVLMSEVVNKVISIMGVVFNSVFLWTDSKITLFRIKSEAYKYATFVANRISKIQQLTSSNDWYYVRSKENPADSVSRGLMPSQFASTSLWWRGPEYLKRSMTQWVADTIEQCSSDLLALDLRKQSSTILVNQDHEPGAIFQRFQSLTRLLRVVSYILRFINNAKTKTHRQASCSLSINPAEIKGAATILIKVVQHQHYAEDIKALNKNKGLSSKSALHSLSVFLDNQGVLRVGGRLNNAAITNDQKHPILLPGRHQLSILLARHEHLRLLHAGPQALLYNLRLSYWIVGGRNLCRSIVHNCIRCFRVRPQIRHQIMGDLPTDRVTRCERAFSIIGLDFCGPFLLLPSVRAKNKIKCYICLFVCFATKAVHLEIVFNSTTEAFLACLRRFVSRRGICSKIYSDNATNFIGARSELQDLRKLFLSQTFQESTTQFCTTLNIEWSTIPPRSPHFAGLWEAAIKSAKHHLKRIIGTSTFSTEEFLTLTTQVEACLNSRPLTPMSDDPSDFSVLSPGHFLIGTPLVAIPEPSILDINPNRLSKFQRIQQFTQRFWDRWHLEYLSELQRKSKWNKESFKLQVGSLVLLHDDNLPPLKWSLGRITKLHPGKDNIVRVVSIKTSHSETKRAVNRISVLPMDASNDSSETSVEP